MLNDKVFAYCTSCGVQVELSPEGSYQRRRPAGEGDLENPYEPGDIPYIAEDFLLCRCPKCESPFLFKREWYEIPAEFETAYSAPEQLYPGTARLSTASLPKALAGPYQDARRSCEAGLHEPCLIMCRKCLEGLCKVHGVPKGNLKSRLARLRDMGVIDAKLHAWTEGLRLIGNDAAHEFEIDVSAEDARDALDFVEAALTYAFVLGKKFEEFQARRQNRKKPPEDSSSATEDEGGGT